MTFVSGCSLILNRQNFEWNKSKFSEQFKASSNASKFMSILHELTTFDTGNKAVPKDTVLIPTVTIHLHQLQIKQTLTVVVPELNVPYLPVLIPVTCYHHLKGQ